MSGWILGGALVAALATAAWMAYRARVQLGAPVERIAAIADRIARGELQLEAPTQGRDEVVQLANAVNRMKLSLMDKIDELDRDGSLLSSLLAGMEEGLLLVDDSRRVRLSNRAITKIFDLGMEPEGRLLAEVVRHPTINQHVETVLRDRTEIQEPTIRVGARSFALRVTPPGGSAGGAIVLLFDVTRIEALESVRQEFVSNVSHELRTPLTSIKAFVETLLSGEVEESENRIEFLRIIGKHAARMEALIDDITDLSRIETGSITLQVQTIDATEVCHEVADDLAPLAHKHGVDVHVELTSPFLLQADGRRLEQILTNLMENAIKFNRRGGSVRISGVCNAEGCSLIVEDEGVGIPVESLDRIFNRFYRVDPARSREAGGTGLGLAIVKHLVRLQGGRVRVESELGQGSRFIVELPPARCAGEAPVSQQA